MTFTQFINKYNNKGVDFDGSYGNQCVDLFRQYVKDVLGYPQPKGVVGAKDFWTNYETDKPLKDNFIKIPNTPDGVPQEGDVMVWGARYGKYGHIAMVTHADVNTFTCFSQNDPIGTLSQKRKYSSYKGVLGWFRPKTNEKPTLPLKDTVIDFDDGEGKRKTVGWYVYEHGVEKTRAEKAEKELDEVREKTTGEIGRLNAAVRDLQSELVNIQKMAKTEIKTMTQHIETGAKYSGSSIAIASALTLLITAFVPEMKDNIEVTTALQSVLTFGLNLVLIRFFKG